MDTKIIVCLDGCGPEYLARSETPNLDALAAEGYSTIGQAIVPTVTNVNNVTIVTARYPETHGITSNYFYDHLRGQEVYMESPEFVLTDTIFRRLARKGKKSILITAKDKLKTLIQDGTTIAESAENPSAWLVDRIGPPPDIYSVEVNHWLFGVAENLLKENPPDLLYLTTTDYATHKLAPEDDRSQWNINQLDRLLGEILNVLPGIEIVVTADHGMSQKTYALDLNLILKEAGITAYAIPIIKDRHVVHHQNLGGSAYVYLDDLSAMEKSVELLKEEKGIESVLPSTEAARKFHLHPQRIGHLFILADADTVFGALPTAREDVNIRSHGSLHEREIPIYAYGAGPLSILPKSNHEVAAWIT
jgi:phosphonoacetate hydrolase